jgi:ATP-dependent DNA helicase DinG
MLTPSEILAADGPLAELIPDYRVRPQQRAMAEAVAAAMREGHTLVCEAGTGTGKTFAYLIPALQSGQRIIISTGTKHLQDQLFHRDVKIIRQALGVPVNITLLKGRANYLCLHRLHLAENDRLRLHDHGPGGLHAVRQWSQQTGSGDMNELTALPEGSALRSLLTSTRENCLGQECDRYSDCFVFRARQRAAEADVVIVNHHLLLADLALKEQGYGELLPAADVVIFDEAHQLPDLASQFFSTTLSSHQYLELVRDCKAAYFEEAADLPEFLPLVDGMENAVRRLRLAFGREERRSAWHRVREAGPVQEELQSLMGRSHDVHQALEEFANRGRQLDHCLKRLDALMDHLDAFLEPAAAEEEVQWLESRGGGFLLHSTPLDIADTFQARLREYDCQCIFTSATLTVNSRFDHFVHQLGLEQAECQYWSSPFDFSRQALLYLPQGLPDPRAEGYTEAVVEAALPVLELARGRAFLLFTSHRALGVAAELVRSRIDFPVLVQGEAPRTELLDAFRRTPNAVLLGTQSFWEGVDVKGQALSCVIIDKLPFASPDDPVLQARLKKLEERGGRPFVDYQVPAAVITLKQGVGRLIRDSADYGVMMICDPRLKTRSYGSIFLKSLPDMPLTQNLSEVRDFFNRFEKGEYRGLKSKE